jgi:hypothetical protein
MTLDSYSYNLRMVGYAIGIWSAAWGFRYWSGVDDPLDRIEKRIRWTVVGISFLLIQGRPGMFRLAFGLMGVAFLAWPNCAYRLGGLLRRFGLIGPRIGSDIS